MMPQGNGVMNLRSQNQNHGPFPIPPNSLAMGGTFKGCMTEYTVDLHVEVGLIQLHIIQLIHFQTTKVVELSPIEAPLLREQSRETRHFEAEALPRECLCNDSYHLGRKKHILRLRMWKGSSVKRMEGALQLENCSCGYLPILKSSVRMGQRIA
ncbi:hypothetical protein C8J56DRAFT_931631 [Mycena floridula]|nr:hypothetical protein C8J56DRAFT_945885 [Mycena floridula]KAJ7591720.1 hypothetical protein C8J56DRAFT_931631 [Mycena floridula]